MLLPLWPLLFSALAAATAAATHDASVAPPRVPVCRTICAVPPASCAPVRGRASHRAPPRALPSPWRDGGGPDQSAAEQRLVALAVRGGGDGGGVGAVVVSAVASLGRTLLQNPLLLLCMVGSSAVAVYKDRVPYAKRVQALLQFVMVGYAFYLLVQWQQAAEVTAHTALVDELEHSRSGKATVQQ